MSNVFDIQDRQEVFEYIVSVTKECSKIVALCQVGSGAVGYNDARSDLDFVIALDADESMPEVMDYMRQKITQKYDALYFVQNEARHLQCYVLSDMLEIDIGYGWYEYAAAWKPAFKVLFDNSGVVEDKMIKSREWMDDSIYGDKQEKDKKAACDSIWIRMMHAAVAIDRGHYFRAIGELEFIRKTYIDLLGDRYRLESGLNREMDKLPDCEKNAIRSTFVQGENANDLWRSLYNLTALVYRELDGCEVPVSQDMVLEYYKDLRKLESVETERLSMRRLIPSDYRAMAAWDMDERVYKYLLGSTCKNPEEPLAWLPKKDPESKTNILMLVTAKSDGHAVGIYALNHIADRDVWTLSYVNRYDDWGKGYTVEGMKALMDHAVNIYGAHNFEGECAKVNTGSARVMQKLGMTFDHASSYTKSDGSATFESEVYTCRI